MSKLNRQMKTNCSRTTDINITLLREQDRKLGQLKSHCCVKAGELSFELKKA